MAKYDAEKKQVFVQLNSWKAGSFCGAGITKTGGFGKRKLGWLPALTDIKGIATLLNYVSNFQDFTLLSRLK